MSTNLNRDVIIGALYDAGLDEDNLYEGYSGRGMYGRCCFGITDDNTRGPVKFLIALARNLRAELADSLADAWTQDNLGLGVVVYFPGYELEVEDV